MFTVISLILCICCCRDGCVTGGPAASGVPAGGARSAVLGAWAGVALPLLSLAPPDPEAGLGASAVCAAGGTAASAALLTGSSGGMQARLHLVT
jgi:hypothetical protein